MKFGDDKDVLKILDQLDDESDCVKEAYKKRIDESLRVFRGETWKGKSPRPPYFLLNLVEEEIEKKTSRISETLPIIRIGILANGLEGPRDMLQVAVKSIWDTREIAHRSEIIALYGAVMGMAFGGTYYNPEINDVDFVIRDPRSVKIDPSVIFAQDSEKAEYQIYEDVIPLSKIADDWPGRGGLVKPDDKVSTFQKLDEAPKTAASLIRSAAYRILKKGPGANQSAIRRAVVKEYWIKDRRKSPDDDGLIPLLEGVTNWASKGVPFPGHRRIIRAGDIILEDTFNVYWDGGYPMDVMTWKIDLETLWGMDDVSGVKRVQEAFNRIGDAYTKNTILNAVERLIIEHGSVTSDEAKKISNMAAQIIWAQSGRSAGIKHDVPPPLPADTLLYMDKLESWLRDKVGTQKSPPEKDVPSIVTGPAIEGLQLGVDTALRAAARRLESFYQRVGQKMISRVFQFYGSDRTLHLVGPSQEWKEFEFLRSQIIMGKNGKRRTEEDIQKAYKDFRFLIDPCSSLPITKQQRALWKMEMAKQGWLHPKRVFEEMEMYNAEELLNEAQKYYATMGGPPAANQDKRKSNSGNSLFAIGGGGA